MYTTISFVQTFIRKGNSGTHVMTDPVSIKNPVSLHKDDPDNRVLFFMSNRWNPTRLRDIKVVLSLEW